MSALQNIPPEYLRAGMARARVHAGKDNLQQALADLVLTLRAIPPLDLTSNAFFQLEVHISETLRLILAHEKFSPLVGSRLSTFQRKFVYRRGNEEALASVLEGLAQIFRKHTETRQKNSQEALERRKKVMLLEGGKLIRDGNPALGKTYLRRAVEEFKKDLPLIKKAAEILTAGKLLRDAGEMYELGIKSFPREASLYKGAVDSWMAANEFERAEKAFFMILKSFGRHASTYGRMARMYHAWQKPLKRQEALDTALRMDPEQPDALELAGMLKKNK